MGNHNVLKWGGATFAAVALGAGGYALGASHNTSAPTAVRTTASASPFKTTAPSMRPKTATASPSESLSSACKDTITPATAQVIGSVGTTFTIDICNLPTGDMAFLLEDAPTIDDNLTVDGAVAMQNGEVKYVDAPIGDGKASTGETEVEYLVFADESAATDLTGIVQKGDGQLSGLSLPAGAEIVASTSVVLY